MEINIDQYITEEEKKEIAIDVFRSQVKKELFNSIDGTVQSDSEIQRVIGNITSEIVFLEVQKYIPDFRELIIKKVRKNITDKDLNYELFRKKDAWGKEESLAVTYMQQEVKNNEEVFKSRIREYIKNFDLEPTINEEVSCKFEELSDTMYKLSELFINKNEN